MDQDLSWGERALAGVERMREGDFDVRSRASSLLLLLRGAYFTGQTKWRVMAEEDLRSLWRSGVHDHIGGGFFSAGFDREWLRPSFEKRLDDNAVLAFLYTEAWESGHMPFYRDAAEEALDFCLRELITPSGLYGAGRCAADGADENNPFLFTPSEICAALGEEDGRHFAECYDVTGEGNCGAKSIPNLLLNDRWHLVPPGYDDFRERLRTVRETRAGLVTDTRISLSWNALLLAALAKAGRVFADRRYLAEAGALCAALSAAAEKENSGRAALAVALSELYAADFDPAHLAAASRVLASPPRPAAERKGEAFSAESDRTLALLALSFDALFALTGKETWRGRRGEVLRELTLRADRHGPESLSGLCVLLSAARPERKLLCVTPQPEPPEALKGILSRYSPDLRVLVKTPQNAAALSETAPWTARFPIGERPLFHPCTDGVWGEAIGL